MKMYAVFNLSTHQYMPLNGSDRMYGSKADTTRIYKALCALYPFVWFQLHEVEVIEQRKPL